MTQPLTEFLLARYTESEAAAWKAGGPVYTQNAYAGAPITPFNDAARVVDDLKAKRAIVRPWLTHEDDEDDWLYGVHSAAHAHVLRLLAQPYADHPDFKSEWRL